MNKPIFTPEDFRFLDIYDPKSPQIQIAERANTKLEKLIESWPVVYGTYDVTTDKLSFSDPQGRQNTSRGHEDTHRARLAFIEPIEPCKHEPKGYRTALSHKSEVYIADELKCKHCGVELVAEWREKK